LAGELRATRQVSGPRSAGAKLERSTRRQPRSAPVRRARRSRRSRAPDPGGRSAHTCSGMRAPPGTRAQPRRGSRLPQRGGTSRPRQLRASCRHSPRIEWWTNPGAARAPRTAAGQPSFGGGSCRGECSDAKLDVVTNAREDGKRGVGEPSSARASRRRSAAERARRSRCRLATVPIWRTGLRPTRAEPLESRRRSSLDAGERCAQGRCRRSATAASLRGPAPPNRAGARCPRESSPSGWERSGCA